MIYNLLAYNSLKDSLINIGEKKESEDSTQPPVERWELLKYLVFNR